MGAAAAADGLVHDLARAWGAGGVPGEKQAVSLDHLDPATTAHLVRREIRETEQRQKGLT